MEAVSSVFVSLSCAWSPNLKKYLSENPDIDRMVKTDNGTYFAFPFIRGEDGLCYTVGSFIRKDWLDA